MFVFLCKPLKMFKNYMSRALDTLQKIKAEIQNDIELLGYAGKSAAEIAIKMNQEISYNPQQYQTTTPDILMVLQDKKLTLDDKILLRDYVILKGLAKLADFSDVVTESKVRRSDFLELGEITQGDVEQSLLV